MKIKSKTLLQKLIDRREYLSVRHRIVKMTADEYEKISDHEQCEWYRTRAMQLSARISELDLIIGEMKGEEVL